MTLIHLHKVCSLLLYCTTEHRMTTTRYTVVSLQQFSQMFKTDNGYRSIHTLKTRGCRLTMAVWGCRLGWHPFMVVMVTSVICPSSAMKTTKKSFFTFTYMYFYIWLSWISSVYLSYLFSSTLALKWASTGWSTSASEQHNGSSDIPQVLSGFGHVWNERDLQIHFNCTK